MNLWRKNIVKSGTCRPPFVTSRRKQDDAPVDPQAASADIPYRSRPARQRRCAGAKTLPGVGAIMFVITGAFWGILYFLVGETLAGSIPLFYAIFSSLSVVLFHLTRRYRFFLFSQLLLVLILPFILMVALGGFISSSAVILWSLLSPLGAFLFDDPRHTLRWLGGYLVLIVLSGFLEFYPVMSHPYPRHLFRSSLPFCRRLPRFILGNFAL